MNLENKTQESVLQAGNSRICSIAVLNGNKCTASGGANYNIRVWNMEEKNQEKDAFHREALKNLEAVLEGHLNSIVYIEITRENKYIISGTESQEYGTLKNIKK